MRENVPAGKIFCKVKDGLFKCSDGEDCNQISGNLVSISEHQFEDGNSNWNVELDDPENGESYVWSCEKHSGLMVTFVNSMLSILDLEDCGDFCDIKIKTWPKGKYSNLNVTYGAEPLKWKFDIGDIPKSKPVLDANGIQVFKTGNNGNEYPEYDHSERIAWLEEKVAKIVDALIEANKERAGLDEPEPKDDVPF